MALSVHGSGARTAPAVQNEIPAPLRQNENTNGLVERATTIFQKIKGLLSAASEKKPNLNNASSVSQQVQAVSKKEMLQNIKFPDGPCLELDLKDFICTDVDIKADCGFKDYIAPNEWHPENVAPHLRDMPQGIIVTVGAERALFDLFFADPAKCEGLVVKDINPRVKAYIDFNVLLLRIAESREEYCALAKRPENDEALKFRLDAIRAKIEGSQDIPLFLKGYYQKYLKDFAGVYYKIDKDWAYGSTCYPSMVDAFSEVNYHKNDALFAKLQSFARAGRIVSMSGEINDLSPLQKQQIAVVDTSNVYAYSILNLQRYSSDRPIRFIWVVGTGGRYPSIYNSIEFTPLNTEEREELDCIHRNLKAAAQKENSTQTEWVTILGWLLFDCHTIEKKGQPPASIYCRETLIRLREFCEKYLFEIPEVGFILMKGDCLTKLKNLPRQSVENFSKDSRLEPLMSDLCQSWRYLGRTYIDFMDIPGWKDEFEKHMVETWFGLEGLITLLRGEGLLQEFIHRFGKDRIARWKPEHLALLGL